MTDEVPKYLAAETEITIKIRKQELFIRKIRNGKTLEWPKKTSKQMYLLKHQDLIYMAKQSKNRIPGENPAFYNLTDIQYEHNASTIT